MSHIVEAKTQILNPDTTLLRRAVELVAGQHENGSIKGYYYTFERQKCPTSLAIFTGNMYRGMAVEVGDDGLLTFIGDDWGYEQEYELMKQQIAQTYVSLATMQALQALGYQVTAEDGEAGRIVISGVTYA